MLLIEFIQFIVTGILLLWIISKMRRIILLSWNERSFRKRKFLVRVREYLWSDLKHLRQSGVEAALVLEFSNGESVKIRPFNPLIRYDDYVTFENFAKRMLKENA